ncbi:hypothetical protein HGA64_02145 [Candidatus Falkowbacteria bacterium]|nr:hypothetical protein [Candidatus Falkowbacteria bacterium]
MSANTNWSGSIPRIRIDPFAKGFADASDKIWISQIELFNMPRSNVTGYTGGYTLVMGDESEQELPPLIPTYTLDRVTTSQGAAANDPWDPINETSSFLTSNGNVFVWLKLNNVYKPLSVNFKWYNPNGTLVLDDPYTTTDPLASGQQYWPYYVLYEPFSIGSVNMFGQWRVYTYVEGVQVGSNNFTLNPALLPVSGLQVSGITATSATLTWSPVNYANRYYVYRDGVAIADTDQTNFIDSSLTPRTSYVYKIVASYDSSVSSSGDLQVTTLPTVPNVPTGLTTSNITASSVTLSWQSVADAGAYNVYRDDVLVGTVSGTSHTSAGLNSATSYTFYVTAFNGLTSVPSASLTVNTLYATPSPATNLAISSVTSTSASLSWTAGANASNYKVYRDGVLVKETAQTSCVDSGLTPSTSYVYHVVATNGDLSASPSQSVTTTTSELVIDRLMATAVTANTVSLVWPQITDATSCQIYRNNELIGETSQTSFVDSGLTSATLYSYSVYCMSNGAPLAPIVSSFALPVDVTVIGNAFTTISASDNGGNSTVQGYLSYMDKMSLAVTTL